MASTSQALPASCVVYIPFGGNWMESFKIPIFDLDRMSSKPLRWLQFLCYSFINVEGGLYDSMELADQQEQEVNYDLDTNDIGHEYYFLPSSSFPLKLSTC
jgi:hypothetical protein